MLPESRQQAWISGLPDLDKEGGIPLETLPFSTPKSKERSLSVTIYASKDVVSELQSLSEKQTTLPTLSLVVRTDTEKEMDNEYLMTEAVIDSVLPIEDLVGAQVINIIFNSISMKMGVDLNPGPPVNCPPIQPTGMNTGWIFGLPHRGIKIGMPIEIVDFSPPYYNRRLTVTIGKPSSEIEALVQNPVPTQELILVLPERNSQRYVEFKLWDANVTEFEDERHIAFESDTIECLTG